MQKKSHEALMKLLNNIGVIGSILAGLVDIVVVIIFVLGIDIEQDMLSTIIYAVINALVGVLINSLLRYQGQKYAEIENEEIRKIYYRKKIQKSKRHLSLVWYNVIGIAEDVIMKGASATFAVAGVIYISIKGSKNPIQILITLATLILFACFGLISMNKSYCRYYDVQIPYMEKIISEREEIENGADKRREGLSDGVRTDCAPDEEARRAVND